MPEKQKKAPSDDSGQYRSAMTAMMIPSIMVVSPLLGFFLGRWVGERFFDQPRLGGGVGLALGILTGVRETVKIIRKLH